MAADITDYFFELFALEPSLNFLSVPRLGPPGMNNFKFKDSRRIEDLPIIYISDIFILPKKFP